MTGTEGTWIDWQCLLDAAGLLARCRYTLQYTYPYAYYMEAGPRKELVTISTRHKNAPKRAVNRVVTLGPSDECSQVA